jgi:Zn-dependent M28 family amino/carboxypeptidase
MPGPRPLFAFALILLLLASTPQAGSVTHRASPPARGFDSARAFDHLRALVAIGPRPPGSAGIQQARAYITSQLKAIGLSATEQTFDAETPLGPMKMANVIVRLPGKRTERLIIGGHYDTKLFREFRFVGASDGGSSAAMLLELARVLKDRERPLTIELVFFDGEEATLPGWVLSGTDHTYGSRHYVATAKKDGSLAGIKGMILLDMVGDRALNIRKESRSTPWMTSIIWDTARRLGHNTAFLDESMPIEDDHTAFLDAGIPAVDVIDLDYAQWHTADDNLNAVSARSLQIVGDVVVESLPKILAKLQKP